MESIIARGPSGNDHRKHDYLVMWEGFTHEENTWESYDNIKESAEDSLKEFYEKNHTMEKEGRYGKEKIEKKKSKRKKKK
jgi:hypothetical protein